MTTDSGHSEMISKSSIHVKEGRDKGRIEQPDVAYELGKIEATKGVNTALAREKELAEGLTATQKENLRAVELLPGKYPHAFVPDVDGTPIREGRSGPYLVTRPVDGSPTVVITQDGIAEVTNNSFDDSPVSLKSIEEMDLSTIPSAAKRGVAGVSETVAGEKLYVGIVRGAEGDVRERATRLKELLIKIEDAYKDQLIIPSEHLDIADLL